MQLDNTAGMMDAAVGMGTTAQGWFQSWSSEP